MQDNYSTRDSLPEPGFVTAFSEHPATRDTCHAEVVSWTPHGRCCAGSLVHAFEIKVHVFSDGEVLTHTVYRTASEVRALHARLLRERILRQARELPMRTWVFVSASARAQQEGALKALLHHCCLVDVHVRSEALQEFWSGADFRRQFRLLQALKGAAFCTEQSFLFC